MELNDFYEDIVFEREGVRVVLEWIGEGLCGDYDETDEDDEPLLRFSVFYYVSDFNDGENNDGWIECDNASYCTQIDARLELETLKKFAELIWNSVKDPVQQRQPIDKICGRLSWMDIGWLDSKMAGYTMPSALDPRDTVPVGIDPSSLAVPTTLVLDGKIHSDIKFASRFAFNIAENKNIFVNLKTGEVEIPEGMELSEASRQIWMGLKRWAHE